MSFLTDTAALFTAGNIVSGLGLLTFCGISIYFAPKMPNQISDFWRIGGGAGKSAPKWIVLLALPVLALAIMAGQMYLTQPDVVTQIKAQSGFWLRLGMSIIAPLAHFWILSHHAKAKTER